MGYSTSPATVKRVKSLLDQMLVATTNLMWPAENAHMLGYHIREAIKVAEKDKQSPYRHLRSKFIIRNKGTHVVAELREITDIVAQLQTARSKLAIENLSTLVEVIGAIITHEAHEMFFPDAILTHDEVAKLYTWCEGRGYNLVVGEGITVTKDDPGEAKWTPEK